MRPTFLIIVRTAFRPPALLVAALIVTGPLTGCDASNSAPTEAHESASVGSRPSTKAELNESIDTFARALALSLGDVRVRQLIHRGVSERFSGAPEILYKDIAGRAVDGTNFRGSVAAALARREGLSPSAANQALSTLAAASARLNIAVPVLLGEWNPNLYTPLVVVAPQGVREGDVDKVKAYRPDGSFMLLDAGVPPDRPTIVVSLSDRTTEDGTVRPEFDANRAQGGTANLLPPPCDPEYQSCGGGGGGGGTGGGGTSTTRISPQHQETLKRIKVINDYEPWWNEPAEIYAQISCSGTGLVAHRGLIGDPEPEDEFHTINRFLYYWVPANLGNACGWIWWEHNQTESQTESITIPSQNGSPAITTSWTHQTGDSPMGMQIINFTDPLTTPYNTGDVAWEQQ